jgi:hypothetical protein
MFRLAMESKRSKGSKIARQVLRDSVSETPVIVRVCCEGYDHIARLNVTCFFELSTSHTHGAHANADFPDRDDGEWLRHTLWFSPGDRIDYKPVHMNPLTVESIPPKARTF